MRRSPDHGLFCVLLWVFPTAFFLPSTTYPIQINMKTINKRSVFSVVAIAVLVASGIYLAMEYKLVQQAIALIHQDMPALLFIALMMAMPVIGFPISIFLILAGIRFGIFYATLLWLTVLPIHVLIGYFLARWARKPLEQISYRMGYPIPPLPEKGAPMFSFLFLAIPGVPYAGKNYILPLAGAPFSYCVVMNFFVQFPQGIPFIILGESVMELDLTLLYISLIIIAAIYFLLRWLKKKYKNKISPS